MKKYKETIINYVIEYDDEFGWTAHCPDIEGCFTQGDSEAEVIKNIRDAILLHLEENNAKKGEKTISITEEEYTLVRKYSEKNDTLN